MRDDFIAFEDSDRRGLHRKHFSHVCLWNRVCLPFNSDKQSVGDGKGEGKFRGEARSFSPGCFHAECATKLADGRVHRRHSDAAPCR